jgi:hypothetical protein
MTFQLLKRGRTTILPSPLGGKVAAVALCDATGKADGASSGVGCVGCEDASPHPLAVNRYAKFATVDQTAALRLLRGVARQLAQCAAEVGCVCTC